jgi:glycosyltransferase involved in cell wall biosynthesis
MSVDVSVVMPTFRRPGPLMEAARSALDQNGAQVEVLVIDDCPQGSAERTVRSLGDPRVRYLRNPEPSGGRPALARNLGWPLARGKYIHFLDDDDIVPAGHYAAACAAFARMPDIGVVIGRVEAFGEREEQVQRDQRLFIDGARRAARSQRLGLTWIWASRLLFQPLMFVGGAAMVRRSCVEAIGGFDANLEVLEDLDLYVRTIRQFGAFYLDRVALQYRVGPSMMHRPNIENVVDRSYRRMQEKFRKARGMGEFYMLKLAARTLLRVV